jgi:hypothetical protein
VITDRFVPDRTSGDDAGGYGAGVVRYTNRRKFVTPSGSKAGYHQFLGYGAPSDTLGVPGDIYVDITPIAYRVFAKYPGPVSSSQLWKEWAGIEKGTCHRKDATHRHFAHPKYRDMGLWTEGGDIIWKAFATPRSLSNARFAMFAQFGKRVVSATELVKFSKELLELIKELNGLCLSLRSFLCKIWSWILTLGFLPSSAASALGYHASTDISVTTTSLRLHGHEGT